ncbi:M1 family metallopeptidase [Chitinophaga sp. MM2321]|uniref:M1 family metallopeptidase n=1 Tax=Chitinophaga sp. MM2321 TaxID=3137178 RepID=UPI0032D57C36
MRNFFYCLILFCLVTGTTAAQQLYMPRNIVQAYDKATRDKNGMPGKNYWQNKGRYDIQITANPPSRRIDGVESITYTNNSPDVLRNIILRLICNVHKPQSPRSGYMSKDFLTDGVTIDTLLINGKTVAFDNNTGTVANIKLPEPLLSKDSMQLQISWHYDMSVLSGREGMIDSTTFFLAYCYPRISVYDDYNGWDEIEHTGRVEFYSDFNDYTVAVKVPKNYVVWGTGTLLNAAAVLQPSIAARLKNSYTADTLVHIATKEEMQQQKVTKQQEWNTWKFAATHIADVTYGLSDHYVWDASSVMVDSTTSRRASVQAAYNDTAVDFHHSVDFSRNALNWFSLQWPGVAYPFPVMTAFQGYADMEFPMMVNDGTVGDDLSFAQLLQDHEIAHTYFPFYMGTNESRYAFMDEGWATTFEYLVGIAEKGKAAADTFYQQFRVNKYINDPSAEEDQPIISMSNQVSGMGYSSNAYGKPSLAYLGLKDLLGDALFRKCLHVYMNNWHGKHPIPWDFFYSFNTAAKQNLDWYWNNWFFSNYYIDLALVNVQLKGSKAQIVVKNTGGFAIPFDVVLTYTDSTRESVHHTPAVWKNNARQVTLTVPVSRQVATIKLDGNLYMDATPLNNIWKK